MELSSSSQGRRSSSLSSKPVFLGNNEKNIVRNLSHRLSSNASVPSFSAAVGKKHTPWSVVIGRLVEGARFNTFIILVVLLDFVFFFMAAEGGIVSNTEDRAVQFTVTIVFVLEMVLKALIYGPSAMFLNTWNLVDSVITGLTVASLVLDYTVSSSSRAISFTSAVPIIRLVRVVRVIRIFRLINMVRSTAIQADILNVRLPLLVCLDILNRAVELVSQEGVRDYVSHLVTADDLKWVISVIQSEKLYFPDIQIDESLPESVRQLLIPKARPPTSTTYNHLGRGSAPTLSATIFPEIILPEWSSVETVFRDPIRWDMDSTNLSALTHGHSLVITAYYLFHVLGITAKLNLSESQLVTFLTRVESAYGRHPYHNAVTATQTIISCAFFLDKCELLDVLSATEAIALFLSALVLDIDHPGLTNTFLVRSGHEYAMKFNDSSPLEHHHLTVGLSIIEQEKILGGLPPDDQTRIQELIINLILSTDMREHYACVAKFSARLIDQTPGFDVTREPDRLLLMKAILRMCDIACGAQTWNLFAFHFAKFSEELFLQGEMEARLGIPVSFFMDRKKSQGSEGVKQAQLAFLNVLVSPLVECISEFFRVRNCHYAGVILDNVDQNRKTLLALETRPGLSSRGTETTDAEGHELTV